MYKTIITVSLLSFVILGCDKTSPGVAKISIDANGTIILNEKTIKVEDFEEELNQIKELKEVWFHADYREGTPHDNVPEALVLIHEKRLNTVFYSDKKFTLKVKELKMDGT